MKQQVQKNPQLRFSEFNDEWNDEKLGMNATFLKGKGISKSDIVEDGKNSCIRYGELYTEYNEVITKDKIVSKTNVEIKKSKLSIENDVLIPSSGETHLDIATASCIKVSGVILGGDLNVIRSNYNGVFLAYYLNSNKKKQIAQLAQGNSVVHLYNKNLSSLSLNIPSEQEQQKIASFLQQVDQKIDLLSQKITALETYKKGGMQKLFSQEIRFKQDDGSSFPDWEEKRLAEFCDFFSGGTPKSTNRLFYSGEIPFIGSGNISDKEVHSFITNDALKSSSAKMVNVGDLLYALYGATSGDVAISKISGAINQAVLCIRSNENLNYLYHLLKFNQERIVDTYIQGGQGNLSAKIVKELKFSFPTSEEQTKIANFLSAIDEKINRTQQQLQQTETFKKGLLQKMFV